MISLLYREASYLPIPWQKGSVLLFRSIKVGHRDARVVFVYKLHIHADRTIAKPKASLSCGMIKKVERVFRGAVDLARYCLKAATPDLNYSVHKFLRAAHVDHFLKKLLTLHLEGLRSLRYLYVSLRFAVVLEWP